MPAGALTGLLSPPADHTAPKSPGVTAIPAMITYQGYLTDSGGNPIDGNVANMTFTIYDALGGVMWTETHTAVAVNEGFLNVLLGSINPINTGHLTGENYLGNTDRGKPGDDAAPASGQRTLCPAFRKSQFRR